MNGGVRKALFALGGALFLILWLGAAERLPPVGEGSSSYADLVREKAPAECGTGQRVAAVMFDYRGFDTLGEEFILFAAACGVLLLLRTQAKEREERPRDRAQGCPVPPPSDLLRGSAALLFPATLVFGLYIVLHGHITPGGGFQGGVLLASAFLFVYLASELPVFEKVAPERPLDIFEGGAAGAFVLAGGAGLAAGGGFLENVLPKGKEGELLSAGLLPVLNVLSGAAVAAGFVLVLSAFLRQVVEIRRKE